MVEKLIKPVIVQPFFMPSPEYEKSAQVWGRKSIRLDK